MEDALKPENIYICNDMLEPLKDFLAATPCDIKETRAHIDKLITEGIVISQPVQNLIDNLQTSISFTTLKVYIKVANFLGIEVLINLFAYLLAAYLRNYINIKNNLKPA